jgi:4-amino-4-deoxy-L-arabinose transferase-like glycosyltransferase
MVSMSSVRQPVRLDMHSARSAQGSDFGPRIVSRFLTFLNTAPLVGLLLFVPTLVLLAPIPIDETRYLAVAWEMRQSAEFLVPHLNGQWYADKPPLLFWLINIGWSIAGVHAWSARAVTLLCSTSSLVLLDKICLRLELGRQGASMAQWILVGTVYFALFANAIMFDVLLISCVLGALLGLLQIEAGEYRRGPWVMGVAIGVGLLAKGPVMLLDIGFAVVLAPWWSARARSRWREFFAAIGCAMLIGMAIGLAWAIPAAIHGGSDYARALFLHQTIDRMTSSFAHARPIWWYAMILPIMLLPWTLAVRGNRETWQFLLRTKVCRFAIAWAIPAFAVFCLIDGKQPHYLLPLLPAFAVVVAALVLREQCKIHSGAMAFLILVLGGILATLPWLATQRSWLLPYHDVSPVWGFSLCALAAALWLLRRHARGVLVLALASLLAIDVVEAALARPLGDHNDIMPIAEMIRDAQAKGQPIAHIGWHHGLYEFAGRLQMPLRAIQPGELQAWCEQNPQGLVVAMDGDLQLDAKPIYSKPFRDARVSVWRAADAVHAHLIDIRSSD